MTVKTKAKRTTKAISKPKTRAQWVKEICAVYKQTIDDILKIGRTLNAAKKALQHGEWLLMVEHDLPFSASMAQQFMKVASDRRIRNAARVRLLPAAVGSLFDLSRLSDAEFKQGLKSGAINPAMKRADVRTIKVNVSHRTERLDVPPAIASTFKVTHLPVIEVVPNHISPSIVSEKLVNEIDEDAIYNSACECYALAKQIKETLVEAGFKPGSLRQNKNVIGAVKDVVVGWSELATILGR